ncbi:MAG: hypothetical protein AAGC64_13625 [Bacteroidota bacterium]
MLTIMIACLNCDVSCNDCLDLTTKNIKYTNSSGTNLLFGDQAIYNPDSVKIKAGNDTYQYIRKQEENGTISFELYENYNTYYIFFSDSLADTLNFELDERKSTLCCGNVTYSTKTLLNRLEIENNDLIVITH